MPHFEEVAESLAEYRPFFGVVGKLLYLAPDKDFINELLREGVFLEWPRFCENPSFAEACSLLQRWATHFEAGLTEDALSSLRVDATLLFSGLQTMAAPPWESVYFNKERMIFQEETLAVRAWYRKYNLEITQFNHEPDDHIGIELEFIAHLLEQAECAEDGSAYEFVREATAFAKAHPLKWAHLWSAKACATAQTDFFKGLVLLVPAALESFAETTKKLGA